MIYADVLTVGVTSGVLPALCDLSVHGNVYVRRGFRPLSRYFQGFLSFGH